MLRTTLNMICLRLAILQNKLQNILSFAQVIWKPTIQHQGNRKHQFATHLSWIFNCAMAILPSDIKKHRWRKKGTEMSFLLKKKGKSIQLLLFQEALIITFKCLYLTWPSATGATPPKKTQTKWNGFKRKTGSSVPTIHAWSPSIFTKILCRCSARFVLP